MRWDHRGWVCRQPCYAYGSTADRVPPPHWWPGRLRRHSFQRALLIFSGKLLQARRRGVFAYGALAIGEGQQFERKWLDRGEGIDESALEVPDFSATTDLYQVVSNVYDMGTIPLDLKDLVPLAIATLLPFVPVALMAVPLDVLLRQLANLLL